MKKKLRILVVLPMYGGSLPIGRYCATALREEGYSVRVFEAPELYSAFTGLKRLDLAPEHLPLLERGFLQVVGQAIWAHVQTFEPHFVLSMAQAPMSKPILDRLRRTGVRTAMWFVEDWQIFNYWKSYAPLYDVFAVIQKQPFLDELTKIGQNNALYLPLACLPSFHGVAELTAEERKYYAADISFLGAGYPNRRMAFRGLLGKNFKIWGSDWENENVLAAHIQKQGTRIDASECLKIYAATTINLNLHSSLQSKELVTHGDFVNPRTFELACANAFQLVDRRTLLPELFDRDELVVFDDIADMEQQIEFYLRHKEERQAISAKACERAKRDHTYAKRMEILLDFVEQRFGWPVFERDQTHEDDPLFAAEIEELLTKLNVGPKASFEEVVERLRRHSGQLNSMEMAVLFLDEWRKQYAKK